MKHSSIFVKNGVIYNEITDIMSRATTNRQEKLCVICHDEEVFDEAMKTLAHRYPKALGLVCEPNPGVKMGKRFTTVKHYDDRQGHTIELDIMTKAEYEANKVAIDAKTYDVKRTIMWTGGQN